MPDITTATNPNSLPAETTTSDRAHSVAFDIQSAQHKWVPAVPVSTVDKTPPPAASKKKAAIEPD